jgi:hypothetical protein
MREGIMSIGVLRSATFPDEVDRQEDDAISLPRPRIWDPESFAQQQIQNLVRRVFFSANGSRPVRQVVFSPVEPLSSVRSLCRRVADSLARQTPSSVAILGACPAILCNPERTAEQKIKADLRPLYRIATHLEENLWLVPSAGADSEATTQSLHCYLGELRREFEYSILEAPPAGESAHATAMAQFADGIILVLSAHQTRRLAARKAKETLDAAQARVLGTVLVDRQFPIPDGIYRRL